MNQGKPDTFAEEAQQPGEIEPVENEGDERRILADDDMTQDSDAASEERANEAQVTTELNNPADFVQGSVDVKEQMDRTIRRAEDAFDHMGVTDASKV